MSHKARQVRQISRQQKQETVPQNSESQHPEFAPVMFHGVGNILRLQRTIGNQQVQRMLVQREIADQPMIRMGSRGDSVSQLQNKLNEMGEKLVVDGIFGPATYQAVVRFQQSAGLAPDGIVGEQTWSRLEKPDGGENQQFLKRGARGEAVEQLQEALNLVPGLDRSYKTSDLTLPAEDKTLGGENYTMMYAKRDMVQRTPASADDGVFADAPADSFLTVDGIFGPHTESVVCTFQKMIGVPATGSVDGALMSMINNASQQVTPQQPIDPKVRQQLLDGDFKDDGAYSVDDKNNFIKFDDGNLQKLLEWHLSTWAVNVPTHGNANGGGDSSGIHVNEHPQWVKEFQQKLIGQRPIGAKEFPTLPGMPKASPGWNEDSEVAQRLVEAYLNAWTKKKLGGEEANGNLQEFYSQIGVSETNDRAYLMGGYKGGMDWCSPASERAVVLSLLRRGIRFKTGQAPVTFTPKFDGPKADARGLANTFVREVQKQGSYFISSWYKQKSDQERIVYGKAAWTAELRPGDVITVINGGPSGGPVQGHVTTVVNEENRKDEAKDGEVMSHVNTVSGNARGVTQGEGSVRTDAIEREMPPSGYSWDAVSGPANTYLYTLKPAYKNEEKTFAAARTEWYAAIDALVKEVTDRGMALPDIDIRSKDWLVELAGEGLKTWGRALKASEAYLASESKLNKLRQQIVDVKSNSPHPVHRLPVDHVDKIEPQRFQNDGTTVPKTPGHSWVVSIVRSSLLDVNDILEEVVNEKGDIDETKLARYGLERFGSSTEFNASINELYPGALSVLD